MGAPGSDKAIAAILRWAGRAEWRDAFDAVIAEHLAPVCEAAGVAPDELPDLLGSEAYVQVIGCALEDFLTREVEPDGRNVVDDYLKRRGWKEPPAVKHYLRALRGSTVSVHEVVATTPGSHFVVRDLVRGGDPVRVEDRLGSANVARWDRLAARLLPIGGKTYMAGGVLRLEFDDAAGVVKGIAELRQELTRTLGREAKRQGVPREALDALPVDEVVLAEAAPLVTGTWLATALERARGGPLPKLVNAEGDELVFCETRFPLADPGRAGEAAARLDRLPGVHRDEPEEPAWTWLATGKASRKARAAAPEGLTFATFGEGGERVLGSMRLEGNTVVLETNSVERAERGRKMVAEALGALAGTPLTSTQTAEQALAERRAGGGADVAEDEPALPPEEAEAAMREVLDRHYRAMLSQPVSMLGGKSPRQAAQSKAGRQQVAEWLKYLENQTAHRAGAGSLPAYDFGWLWEELRIADLRR